MTSAEAGVDGRLMEHPVDTVAARASPVPLETPRVLQRSGPAVLLWAKPGTGQRGQKGTVSARFFKGVRCIPSGSSGVILELLWLHFDNFLTTLASRAD
jgi:hypothetical protein